MINFARPSITSKEINAVINVLKSGWITTGHKNLEFAKEINKIVGSKYCVPLNSCTASIHLALIAAGVKENDEIITTPMTFVSTINSILYLKAKPIFVDIKENDFIMDEERVERFITKKTKAILTVHYGGFSANLDKLTQIAKKYKLELIEDAAHSFGSKYKKKFIGQDSKYCCFSFYPTKNITTGEGGAFVTNNNKIFKRVSRLGLHGISKDAWKRYSKVGSWKYDVKEIGFKYNMTDIQAAIGLAQLSRYNELKKHRKIIYGIYSDGLSKVKEVEIVKGNNYSDPFQHLFVIRIKSKVINRNVFIEKMKEKNIICSVHFIPVYRFSVYKKLLTTKVKDYPQTEKAFQECVSIPFSSSITKKEATTVIKEVNKIFS